MTVYYNENDPFAAAWLRELMAGGLIPGGEIDTRSIVDVRAADLGGYTQHHFFAGIGGWAYALQLAGWPEDRPVWTGSCPCQPFSIAGKRKGTADERHLWPEFRRLLAECRPPIVFGEQVTSKDGRLWLAGVRADLETLGYGVGAADLCAAGVGAPHIRQRLFWVADAGREHSERWREFRDMGSAEVGDKSAREERQRIRNTTDNSRPNGRMAKAVGPLARKTSWSRSTFIPCADGKFRRVPTNEAGEPEPSLFPLAHGVPNRVGTLRGVGNAIVPQVAAEFIRAAIDF